MPRQLYAAASIVQVIALGLLIVGVVGLLALKLWGGSLLSVQTASMAPNIRVGDAVLVKPQPFKSLRIGDIISYRNPHSPNVLITHRLTSINRRDGQLITAGDALGTPDPSFSDKLIVGRAVARAPKLGTVIDFARRPIGLLTLVYLPALLILTSEVVRLSDAYARPFYSVRL